MLRVKEDEQLQLIFNSFNRIIHWPAPPFITESSEMSLYVKHILCKAFKCWETKEIIFYNILEHLHTIEKMFENLRSIRLYTLIDIHPIYSIAEHLTYSYEDCCKDEICFFNKKILADKEANNGTNN